MNETNQPHGPGNRKSRRRKRGFGPHAQNNGQNQNQGQGQGQGRQDRGQNRQNRNNRGQRRNATFVGPMDHSYRSQNGGGQGSRFHNGLQGSDTNMEPLKQREDAPTRIFCLIDDLFFLAKIQETARKLNVKVEFVKSEKEITDKYDEESEEKPSLIIVDLNSNSIKPLPMISKLRSKFKKATSIVGFVSHVQGDLKVKAQEAGCDVVMPRSAFSQNLPSILRRHGAEDEPEDNTFNKA
jgi:CheY-like chemotaxis protein